MCRLKMWKLKIAEGGNPWLRSLNDHVGRQTWEFDPKLGSPEELAEIEKVRETFRKHRFEKKHSSDLLMRIQVSILYFSLSYLLISIQVHMHVYVVYCLQTLHYRFLKFLVLGCVWLHEM